MKIEKNGMELTLVGHCYSNQFNGIGVLTKDSLGNYIPIPEKEFKCKFLFSNNKKLEEFFSTHPDDEGLTEWNNLII